MVGTGSRTANDNDDDYVRFPVLSKEVGMQTLGLWSVDQSDSIIKCIAFPWCLLGV